MNIIAATDFTPVVNALQEIGLLTAGVVTVVFGLGLAVAGLIWVCESLWSFYRSLVETANEKYDRENGTTDGNG